MRLHRFFIAPNLIKGSTITILEDSLIHQFKHVFRFEKGDKVIILDNSGVEYLCSFTLVAKDKVELDIEEKKVSANVPDKETWLYAALVKKDNFEWIIEKATELGVSHIVPVLSERSEKKDLNYERAQKILTEASEQSGRGTLPTLHQVVSLSEAIDSLTVPALVFHTEGEVFEKNNHSSTQAVFVGPEGGWSDKEIELFKEKNVPINSLGKQVLRAETAAIVAVWSII